MYNIEFTEQAMGDIQWFKKHEQNIIFDGIDQQLAFEPTVPTRNRKELQPNSTASWELRIGAFRVFYDVDGQVRIVAVQRVGEKQGNIILFRGQKGTL